MVDATKLLFAITVFFVKMKSLAVTGWPSLQTASGSMWYVSVNGPVATSTLVTS